MVVVVEMARQVVIRVVPVGRCIKERKAGRDARIKTRSGVRGPRYCASWPNVRVPMLVTSDDSVRS